MSTIAITYPLTLPSSPAPTQTRIALSFIVGRVASPFTAQDQVQDYGGRFWTADITLPPMLRAAADSWLAFFAKLRGRYGYFTLGDWDRRTPRGAISGTVLVKGGSQTGNGLLIDGLPLSTTNVLRAGDHVSVGNYLYMNVADVNSNGSGEATIQIEPSLRSAPADNAVVTYTNPQGYFRLAENAVPWDADAIGLHGLSFRAVERV